MGARFDAGRFVPYVMMHEFEALLFSDCEGFARGIDRPEAAVSLQAIRDGFASPEEIDDSPETAPSKRVESLVSGYQKPLMGALAALEIGLGAMRRECPHFGAWLHWPDTDVLRRVRSGNRTVRPRSGNRGVPRITTP